MKILDGIGDGKVIFRIESGDLVFEGNSASQPWNAYQAIWVFIYVWDEVKVFCFRGRRVIK